MLFTIIPDAQVVLRSKGIFKQAALYSREGRLYAKWGSGFIGLRHTGSGTTVPHVLWEHIEGVAYTVEAPYGALIIDTGNRSKRAA